MALCSYFQSALVSANEDWSLCSIPIIEKRISKIGNAEQPINIYSNALTTTNNDLMSLSGDVVFDQRPDTHIEADSLLFNQQTNNVSTISSSIFTSEISQINSQSFSLNSSDNTGEFNHISMQLFDTHQFASAEKLIQINDNEQQLESFKFSSCEPSDNAWALKSANLHLDHSTGLGVAKHARIYLFDVPIFYFPYFQFPIDNNRHSGLLMPSLTLSGSSGSSVNVPVYWNIHPQLDSTIAINYFSNRGIQINTETRYLTSSINGVLTTSTLDDQKESKPRYYYNLTQQSRLNRSTHVSLLAQTASDQAFFDDFGAFNFAKTPDYLERHLDIKHSFQHWNSQLLIQNYQTLNLTKSVADQPYAQLPKVTLNGAFRIFDSNTTLNINQSLVHFEKSNSTSGNRFIFNPILRHEWNTSYSYVKPQISFSLSQYQITHTDNSHEDISRQLNTISIDSGLFFERIADSENEWIQTLEPRLFYLQTPFKDQSNIPDFDSALLTNNYANLFSINRFSGGDRIGDTQQLTFGLSSQLLSLDSGLELLRLSLGQSFYALNRKVQLAGTTINKEKTSDLFLELSSQPYPEWKVLANATKQAETGFISQKTMLLSRQKNGHVFNLSYRFKGVENNTELEQSDVSIVYPIDNQWKLFAKRQYSLIDNQIVEQLIGTSYDSCCWQFSIMALESSDDNFLKLDRSIYLQLSLKGLSNIGRNNDTLLQKKIAGYH